MDVIRHYDKGKCFYLILVADQFKPVVYQVIPWRYFKKWYPIV